MNKFLISASRILLTLVVVAIAVFIVSRLWVYYTRAPWTRDGHIRADVVQLAPDVSGLITLAPVHDNQLVRRGDVLFVIDRARYEVALLQAQATVAAQQSTLAQARREAARNTTLGDLVAREVAEESAERVAQAQAALQGGEAGVAAARLNLQRTTVISPVDGFINDRAPREGEYVTAGRPVLSIVDAGSFRVEGYFEETKLHGVHLGQAAEIRIMGEPGVLHGHVLSIAAGIEDRDRTSGGNLLPNVNPAFSWVRLAQRIPVRISLDDVPADLRLISGRTATVSIVSDATARRRALAQ
ncbi:MAG: efflux RND transporter periplasmic adaptor subunit [Janthinobacterium lividum]